MSLLCSQRGICSAQMCSSICSRNQPRTGFTKRRPAARRPTAHGPRPAARSPPHGPRPAARGPPHGPRPTAHGPRPAVHLTARGPAAHLTARGPRPTSRPAARGPQIFGQWYIKAHAQIGISGVWSTVV